MNLFIKPLICLWDLLPFTHHCCPRHLQHYCLNATILLSLDDIGGVPMAAGVLLLQLTEAPEIIPTGLIFVTLKPITILLLRMAPKIGTAAGKEIGSAEAQIPAASYVTILDTLLLSVPNFSNAAMDNNIVPIWHSIILQVLLNGFQTPVQTNTSH